MTTENQQQPSNQEKPEGNSPKAEQPNPPKQEGNPRGEEPTRENSTDAKFEQLQAKVETLTRQYDASTKEGLRLKGEVDKLKEENAELRKKKSADASNFDKVLEEQGLQGAVNQLLENATAPLKDEIARLKGDRANEIVSAFRNAHAKAFAVEGFDERFAAEYDRVKAVYDNPNEALEKAYILAGGRDAELQAGKTQEKETAEEEARRKAEKAAAQQASAGEQEQRTPVDQPKGEAVTLESLAAKHKELWQKYYALGPSAGYRNTERQKLIAEIDRVEQEIAVLQQAR